MPFTSKKKLMAFHVSVPRILDMVSVTESLTNSSKLVAFHPLIPLAGSFGIGNTLEAGVG